MQEYFDEGYIYTNNRGTNKIGYRLDIGKYKSVIEVTEQLLPFLREKKERAKVLLQFCRRRQQICAEKKGKHLYITDDFEDYFLLRELNKTGIIPYQRESIL